MNAVAFDTLKFARSLRDKAHLPPDQAEGISDALAEVFAGSIPTKSDIDDVRSDIEALRISTKADLESLRLSTRADLDGLRLSTKADLEATKSDIIKWMFGTIGFQTVVVLGAVVALARSLH